MVASSREDKAIMGWDYTKRKADVTFLIEGQRVDHGTHDEYRHQTLVELLCSGWIRFTTTIAIKPTRCSAAPKPLEVVDPPLRIGYGHYGVPVA